MDNLKLGQIITTPQQRDAIHIAVVPLEAGALLPLGTHIVLGSDGRAYPTTTRGRTESTFGVLDPFLSEPALPHQTVWVFLYPGSITSLRHDWTHPQLPSADYKEEDYEKVAEARKWLTTYANTLGLQYATLFSYLAECVREEREHIFLSMDSPDGGVDPYVWEAYSIITGQQLSPEHRRQLREDVYFSCAC